MRLLSRPRFCALLWKIACVIATGHAVACHAQESLTLRKIRETGLITIGYRDGSIPFSYLDDRQKPIGFSMDICYRVVDDVRKRLALPDLQVQLRPVNSATRIPMVANNVIDLECGTTTNTPERERHVSFSVTTFVALSRLASLKSANISELRDLRGRTVVSTAGSTSIAKLIELNNTDDMQMTILAGKDHLQSFHMMETGRAVAFAMDDVLLHGLVTAAADPSRFRIGGSPLSVEPYAIGLPKGDPEFKKLVDGTIIGLFRSGQIYGIYHKWFESPIPPRDVNLHLPMSDLLKKLIENPTDSGDPAAYRGMSRALRAPRARRRRRSARA
jgi:glutamate/aspartate transport system substrate-binding protein